MVISIIIAAITALSLIACVFFKPYVKIGGKQIGLYWIVCLLGAGLQLAFRTIPVKEVVAGVTADTSVNPLKILTLFLSITMLSIFLGESGFFEVIAERVFLRAKGRQIKLFFLLYAVVAVLTVFTSNDIIILTFTPPICIFARRAKVSPFPYLFGEFVAANTCSMFLVVGNPTNIYLAASYGISFFRYFTLMFLPAFVCGGTALAATLFLFKKPLMGRVGVNPAMLTGDAHEPPPASRVKIVPMVVSLVHLLLCIIMLAISDFIGVEMYLICFVLFLSLTLFHLIYELFTSKKITSTLKTIGKAPFELIPFVLSMFVIVLSLSYNGVTDKLGAALLTGTKADGVIFGFLSALSSNFLNNIPMSVLFERIIDGNSLYAVLGTVIGSNVGAVITPLGALAGIMWNRILRTYGTRLSFSRFFRYGVSIAFPALLFSTLSLFLV